jgi:hypothetical protein
MGKSHYITIPRTQVIAHNINTHTEFYITPTPGGGFRLDPTPPITPSEDAA